ncbi:MAG: TRAP transporter fused permease subunit [Sulfolobales archaeon]|nr:TRAP transporter fused permease subunit [Sulfolobales archaeon]MDW7969213.1 TRAP transporter fused permease subunit [Sulfolobales archaeon]
MPKRVLGRKTNIAVIGITGVMALYNIYVLLLTAYDVVLHMVLNAAFVLPLSFIVYAARAKDVNKLPWYDIVLALVSAIPPVILYLNPSWIYERMWFSTSVTDLQLILGVIFIATIVEATRRAGGLAICLLVIFFLVYLNIGPSIPDPFRHRGMRFDRIVELNYLTTYGTFTTPLQVMSTYVIAFTILGAVFNEVGIGKFFIDLAKALVGKLVGGPAKIAVVASSLFGTISGSAVANVYGTGIITIPTMKSLGYPSRFAGAVEAVASTGGQIMPPVMGAAAFVMAELLNVPYARIMVAAIIPALLYYLGVYVQVHYYSVRHGLKGLPKEEIPSLKKLMIERGYMLIPMAVLVYIVAVMMWSPVTAAFIAMFITIALSYIKRDTWMTPKKIYVALAKGAEEAISILVIGAAAGIIIGSISFSGTGLRLSSLVLEASMGILVIALLFVAMLTLIMGMGVPTTAAYVMTAALSVPALARLGVDTFPSHFFIFYYATISAITPPVALAAYAAASIAKDDPMRIGFLASRLGFAALIVPFIIIFKPGLLLVINEPLPIIVENIVTAFIATYALGLAFEGFYIRNMNIIERVLLIAGGLLLFAPTNIEIDILASLLIAIGILIHRKRSGKAVLPQRT